MVNTAQAGSSLIFLPDVMSKKSFLVDTGASLSILPHKLSDSVFGPKLVSVNGSAIPAWGFKNVTVQFGLYTFTYRFLLADVKNPILGFDFLK